MKCLRNWRDRQYYWFLHSNSSQIIELISTLSIYWNRWRFFVRIFRTLVLFVDIYILSIIGFELACFIIGLANFVKIVALFWDFGIVMGSDIYPAPIYLSKRHKNTLTRLETAWIFTKTWLCIITRFILLNSHIWVFLQNHTSRITYSIINVFNF